MCLCRHFKQNVWEHGSNFGCLKSSKQMPHSIKVAMFLDNTWSGQNPQWVRKILCHVKKRCWIKRKKLNKFWLLWCIDYPRGETSFITQSLCCLVTFEKNHQFILMTFRRSTGVICFQIDFDRKQQAKTLHSKQVNLADMMLFAVEMTKYCLKK